MGRSYYCDYCDKRFKSDPVSLKKHLNGMQHQIERKAYYAQFKLPKNILRDEFHKKPCTRFESGECRYGALCRFSHYTRDQLATLRKQVELEDQVKRKQQQKVYSRHLIDDFLANRQHRKVEEQQRMLNKFYNYPKQLRKIADTLPPSLQPLNVEELSNLNPKDLKFFG